MKKYVVLSLDELVRNHKYQEVSVLAGLDKLTVSSQTNTTRKQEFYYFLNRTTII